MEYFTKIKVALDYIESQVLQKPNDAEVANMVCFSLPHFRSIFRTAVGKGLSTYIRERRLYHAAFRIKNTDDSILNIAMDYGFGSHEAFTRAFTRLFGVTPRQFRTDQRRIDIRVITPGLFGPVIIKEDTMIEKPKGLMKDENSVILQGVRKVSYFSQPTEVTPFPSSLRSCLLYLDNDVPYDHLLCTSGAAFRMIWNTTMWDGGNVDITYLCDDIFEPLRRACHGVGIEFNMLYRKKNKHNIVLTGGVQFGDRVDFLNLIKQEINAGRPLVGFGIIGPPEACVIAGYSKNGEELTGWNFFQGMPEFAGNIQMTEEGYFIKPGWYENPDTMGVLSLDKTRQVPDEKALAKETLLFAVTIMSPRKVRNCAGGLDAFTAWAEKLADQTEFPPGMQMAQLFERVMCHGDACTMVGEGRWYAHTWTSRMANKFPQAAIPLNKASEKFKTIHDHVWQLWQLIGGIGIGKKQARNLSKRSVREKSIVLINKIKDLEREAIPFLKEAADLL